MTVRTVDVISGPTLDADIGLRGPRGASAYQVAVAAGYAGSESDWLASLVGSPGDPGADGGDGQDGADGASAYELAVAAGFGGTMEDWLASLVGPQGEAGADGADGQDGAAGANGAPGQSASIIAYTDEAAYNAAVTANAANPLVLVVRYAQP